MKKQQASRSAFFDPRFLVGPRLGLKALAGLALAVAFAASSVAQTPTPTPCQVWSAGPNLPVAGAVRAVGAYFPANGRFYAMGGRASDTAGSDFTHPFEYSPGPGTWATKVATYPDNQVNNMACGVLTVSGTPQIYCVGGSAAGGTTAASRVFSYNPATDTITTLTAPDNWPGNPGSGTILPGGFAVAGNKLYIIGGFNIGTGSTAQTWQFDPTALVGSRWVQRLDYPVMRSYVPATSIAGLIYTGGGSNIVGATVTDSADSYKYDPGTNIWTAITNIPRATGETRAVVMNGQMWVLGGGRTTPNPSNEVDIYDPGSNTWTTGLPFGTARRNFPADSDGTTRVWLAGGYTAAGGVFLNTMEIYGPGVCQTPTPSPTPTPTATPSPGCGLILYDQTDFAGTNATVSQNFETANDNLDSDLADDFVVPPGQTWTIQQVVANGVYFNGPGPADSFNVKFYMNSGSNLPGTVILLANGTSPYVNFPSGTFTIYLPAPAVLGAGTYWVEVQANMNLTPNGEWGWTDRTVTSNTAAAWQNPGGGFATTCTTWGRRGADCAIDAPNPDQVYKLVGCLAGTPTPTATASPTATATATATVPPTPTPTPATPTPSPGACSFMSAPVYPVPVLDEAVASVGGNLYAFAGVSNGAIVATSNKFDGTTWTSIAPLPVALEYPAAVTDGTDIYILGGSDSAGVSQTTLYRYNVGLNTYTTLAPFATATWNHAAVYLNGKIYKFAGSNNTASTTALEIYDVVGNSWSVGAPYPVALSFVGGFTQGGFIYGAGGIDATSAVESLKTYRYDPVANTWDDPSIADLPATRWGAATTFYNCCPTPGAIMAGGYSGGVITNTAIIWDPVSNTWSNLNPMLGERSRMNGAVLACNFYVIGGRSNASNLFIGTNDNQKFSCPCATTYAISGTVGQCTSAGVSGAALAGATMTRTGTSGGSTTTDGAGFYSFSGLAPDGTYTVTPTKTYPTGSLGFSVADLLQIQGHTLLRPGFVLTGCRLTACDVNNDNACTTTDIIGVNAFILQRAAGFGRTGTCRFTPPNRSYPTLGGNQPAQNYDTIIFGNVTGSNPPRPGGPPPEAPGVSTVGSVALPDITVDQSKSNFIAAVKISEINAKNNLVGFQGDFTFDERVVTFESEPVQKAGLTAGNWNVSGNVLPGAGPIRTLRVTAYSTDFAPLSGSGTLFELRMTRVSKAAQGTQLTWAPSPNQLIFFDADLKSQTVGNASPGRVTTK